MSQEPLRAGPVPDDATSTANRTLADDEPAPAGTRHPSRRPPLRARPQSWHPYGPVEPPLELSSSRSIGVHAILNPPAQADPAASSSREPLDLPGPSSSPRPRQGSSPVPRSRWQQPLSPRSRAQPLLAPESPPGRFGGSGRTSGHSSVSHSPLVPHEPSSGLRQTTSSSPLALDTALRAVAALPGTQPPSSTSLHSTPNVHSRRAGTGQGPLTTPNSQGASPITPHSGYSHFGRTSPANAAPPPSTAPAPYTAAPPYMTMEPVSRGPPATAGPHNAAEDRAGSAGTPGSATPLGGLIPCVLDLQSGSSSQAEKRKANSDASRRFRNRKRNEMQLEQRLNAQQDELQRHVETVRRQSEDIRILLQQREHYRSERDYFRDQLDRSVSLSQLPARPVSPRPVLEIVHPSDTAAASTWTDPPQPAVDTKAPAVPRPSAPQKMLDPRRSQSSWPGSPASYSPVPASAGRAAAPAVLPPVVGGSLPPFQGSWPRS